MGFQNVRVVVSTHPHEDSELSKGASDAVSDGSVLNRKRGPVADWRGQRVGDLLSCRVIGSGAPPFVLAGDRFVDQAAQRVVYFPPAATRLS